MDRIPQAVKSLGQPVHGRLPLLRSEGGRPQGVMGRMRVSMGNTRWPLRVVPGRCVPVLWLLPGACQQVTILVAGRKGCLIFLSLCKLPVGITLPRRCSQAMFGENEAPWRSVVERGNRCRAARAVRV